MQLPLNYMITHIPEPRVSPEIIAILDRLESKGWKFRWCINTELQGDASANFDEHEISFKSEEIANDPGVVLHELLHFDQFDKGYPRLKCDKNPYGIGMLNDVFAHALMSTEIEKAGFSIGDQEIPATTKLILSLTSAHPPLSEDEELFAAALYIRAHFLEVEKSKLKCLEEYIQRKNIKITLPQIEEVIKILPKADCSTAEYTDSLQAALSALHVEKQVTIVYG